jgi:hypothetical protein
MANFEKPLQDLATDARAYVDLQVDDLKLKVTKGLSLSLAQVLSMLLVVISLSGVLLALGAGCVLLLGKWIGSYAGAAFIMAGVFALATLTLFLNRKKMFVNGFVKLFAGILFEPEAPEEEMV